MASLLGWPRATPNVGCSTMRGSCPESGGDILDLSGELAERNGVKIHLTD